MFTLGIPKRDYRRATQVLGYESSEEIPYNALLQDDGFYIFSFPEVEDEYDFRKIVNKLKGESVRIICADAQLTEKNIMKLTDLVKENFSKNLDVSSCGSSSSCPAFDIANSKDATIIPFVPYSTLITPSRTCGSNLANSFLNSFGKGIPINNLFVLLILLVTRIF